MAVDITASLHIEGVSDVSGSISPLDFTFTLTNQKYLQRLEVKLLPSDENVQVTIPPIGTQSLIFIHNDLPVTFRVNEEAVDHVLPVNGGMLLVGGPTTTDLFFDGSGSPEARVFIMLVGA